MRFSSFCDLDFGTWRGADQRQCVQSICSHFLIVIVATSWRQSINLKNVMVFWIRADAFHNQHMQVCCKTPTGKIARHVVVNSGTCCFFRFKAFCIFICRNGNLVFVFSFGVSEVCPFLPNRAWAISMGSYLQIFSVINDGFRMSTKLLRN